MKLVKFRYWDGKEMKYITISNAGEIRSSETQSSNGIRDDIRNYKLMQFTGRFDKSGVEIYEDDYVMYERKTRCHVAYSEKIMAFVIGFEGENNVIHYFRVHALNRLEVIGNIFEGDFDK